MSDTPAARLAEIRTRIAEATRIAGRPADTVTLIAVSKTFDTGQVRPLIAAGQRVFGENRVQEAQGKWPALKAEVPGLHLHLIGPLQSNKAKEAVALFDVVHTLDREKIARALADECAAQGRKLSFFVQVNTGEEPQKAGVAPGEVDDFVAFCHDELALTVAGLMCIPPVDEVAAPHFALLAKIAERNRLPGLSMGMSADFESAVRFGATHVRVGSALFGSRAPAATGA